MVALVTVVTVAVADVVDTNVTMTALAVPSLTTSTQAETAALLLLRSPSLVLTAKLIPMHLVSILPFPFNGEACTNAFRPDGGYQNYLALWYQSYAQNAAAGGGQGDATQPPGTS